MTRSYVNLPKTLKREDYEECCRLAVVDASSNETVRAVYLMGAEWQAGVSDLDLVIIYKAGATPRPTKSPWGLSSTAKFIFAHRYLSIDEKSFRYFYYLYPAKTARLRLLWGEGLSPVDPLKDLSAKESPLLLVSILTDVLINKLLLFPKYLNGEIDVRGVIGQFYSLVYSFDILEQITGERVGVSFEASIINLRASWLDQSPEINFRELENLITDSVPVVMLLVTKLGKYLKENVELTGSMRKLSNNHLVLKFVSSWNEKNFLQSFLARSRHFHFRGRTTERFFLLLPKIFGRFLSAYASGDSKFSRIWGSASSGLVKNVAAGGVAEHLQALSLFYESAVASNGLFKIPYTYGFSTQRKSIKTRSKKLIEALLLILFSEPFLKKQDER